MEYNSKEIHNGFIWLIVSFSFIVISLKPPTPAMAITGLA